MLMAYWSDIITWSAEWLYNSSWLQLHFKPWKYCSLHPSVGVKSGSDNLDNMGHLGHILVGQVGLIRKLNYLDITCSLENSVGIR